MVAEVGQELDYIEIDRHLGFWMIAEPEIARTSKST